MCVYVYVQSQPARTSAQGHLSKTLPLACVTHTHVNSAACVCVCVCVCVGVCVCVDTGCVKSEGEVLSFRREAAG